MLAIALPLLKKKYCYSNIVNIAAAAAAVVAVIVADCVLVVYCVFRPRFCLPKRLSKVSVRILSYVRADSFVVVVAWGLQLHV